MHVRFILQPLQRLLICVLIQVQARLQHHNDTEGQLAQLMSRHANETHVYHEQLRRCHEQVRALEQRLKDREEQLQKEQAQQRKSRATVARLKRLLAQEDLEARDELSRKLEKEKSRAQVAEEKMKVNLSWMKKKKKKSQHCILKPHNQRIRRNV